MLNPNKSYLVYKHTTPINKVYIGITCETLAQRCKRGKGYRNNQAFWKAIQKYGWDNIRHEILFSGLTKEQAEQKEIELIAFYKSDKKSHGYNITSGGGVNSGFHLSKKTKDKISKANSGTNNGMYGKRFTQSQQAHDNFMAYVKTRDYSNGNNPKAKKVFQYTQDGKLVKEWDCIKNASDFLGISYSYLIKIMKAQKLYNGFLWAYEEVR